MSDGMKEKMRGRFDPKFYKSVVDQIHANIYITDIETDEIVYMNDFMKKTFGLTDPEGEKCWQVLQKGKQERCGFCRIGELMQSLSEDGCLWNEYNTITGRIYTNYDIVRCWNGRAYHIQYSTDVTDSLQLSMDAAIDELTGLLNRKAGKKQLQDMLCRLEEDGQMIVALCDINGLKWVNDTYGHQEGDRMLRYAADTMQSGISDPAFLFRLSGDEFIIVFPEKELYQAESWMKTTLQALKDGRKEAEIDYEVSFCYGLVKICGKDNLDLADVLGLADTEMYVQKRNYHIRYGKKMLQSVYDKEANNKFKYNKDHLFEAFAETADGYVFAGNLKTGEFMYSKKMVREFGLPGQVINDAAAFWGERIHPQDRELFLRSNQEIADGKSDRHTIRYRAKNASGKWVHLLCKGRMIRDQEGEADLFAGVIRNLDNLELKKNLSVSAQSSFYYPEKMAEEMQFELEEALLSFVNRHIPGGIIATRDDEQFSIVCFNQSLIEYMDYTHEEFMVKTGGTFWQFIYKNDREKVLESVRSQLWEKEVYEIYYRIIRSDGSLAWVYDVGKYQYNSAGERFILSLLMDATDEIEKGRELRFINERGSFGVFKAYLTENFELTYANDGFCQIFGYTREQMKEETGNNLARIIDPADASRILSVIFDTMESGGNQVTLKCQMTRRDGTRGYVRADCSLARHEDGRIIMMGILMDITEQKILEEQLYHTEQIYRFIGNYTKLDVWEYHIADDSLMIHDVKDGIYKKGKIYQNFPEELAKDRRIHPDSVPAFGKLCEQIRRGEEKAVGIIQAYRGDGGTEWYRITSIAMREEDGSVKGAIGLAEDITVQKEAEMRAFRQEKMREMLSKDTLYSVHINLETNKLEAVWSDGEELDIGTAGNCAYESVYEKILISIANEDDRKYFREQFSPEKIHIYEKEENFFRELEFRQVSVSGQIIWANLSFRIISSPTNGNKILFLYARNIDMVKRRELSLQKKAEIDEVTGLYNLTTTKLLIENILQDTNKNMGESAFVLLDIDKFREVNRRGGFATGDELLRQVGSLITKKASDSSVRGRINGDTFAVYFYGRKTKKLLRQEIQELFDLIGGSYICGSGKFDISVSVGAVCPNGSRATYDTLYQNAYNALDAAKRSGGGHLTFYRESGEVRKDLIGYEYDAGSLARRSLEWIKKGESKKEVYRSLLEYLDKYYDAEEVTLYQRTVSGETLRIVGWNDYKKGATLEIRKENVGYLFEILQEAAPEKAVYISGPDSIGYELAMKAYERDRLEYPILLLGEVGLGDTEYLILVEKCETGIRDRQFQTMFMEMIRWIGYLYYVQESCEKALQHDPNTGILNYECFVRRIENMNEDTISTLGMIGVQMVDLKKYNQQYGMVKGDESIRFAASCMVRIFGRANCYRVGRTSFFVVCENMVYEQFMERFRQLEQELERNYYEWIVTSSAWEQNSISARKMKEQVEEKIAVAQNKKRNQHAVSEKAVLEIKENIQELIDNGSFRIFLQPKADTDTGEICGAEALVRLYDRRKGLIPPTRFLPAIEQAGLIRHIDLFILDGVCRMMKQWIGEGWQPFPVSLNYSRMTILEPDILSDTNRIVERYGIAKNLIEIEITESIGSIDSVSLKNIVDCFTGNGYRIALDDYGAEYSNIYVLYSLQLSTLKLDRRIINDVYHDMKARVIVKNVIDICRQFKIKSVAEGVETKEHLEVLREMSCDMIQGYYLNKPLPEEEFYEYYISCKE